MSTKARRTLILVVAFALLTIPSILSTLIPAPSGMWAIVGFAWGLIVTMVGIMLWEEA